MPNSNVVKINAQLEDSLNYLEKNRDIISNIIVLVETADGYIRYFNTSMDMDFMYLMSRKVREDLDVVSYTTYEDDEEEYYEL